ncbi:MAG: glycosyltransferase family 2 protein [Bacteroidales bacterium]|nr:glycosyltransferase family 2 protein [Candidatus Colimorpha onthohippi]
MKTAIVILNWNGRDMLERFLPSVTHYCPTDAEVIVADNGSTDDSVAFLQQHYPTLRTIILDKNYGFAEGYNRALQQVEASYFVLLNSDVEVTPHWVEPVVAMMDNDPTIGMAQPKMLMFDQRDTFEYAGGAGGFIDSYGYPFCRGRLFNCLEQDHGQYDDRCEIFWASGAAMFVRSGLWRQLEGLDGDFFAHMEEIDFCWRAKNAGYKAYYCPESIIYHVGGGTLPKSSPRKTYLNFRNNMALLYKNLPQKRLGCTIALRYLLDGVAALKFLAEGHPQEFKAVYKAHQDFRKWRPNLKAKRLKCNPQPATTCMYRKLLLIQHYLLRKKTFTQLYQ